MTSVLPAIQILKQNMMGNIIGQEEVIDRLLISLLLNGNLLVEGLPGLAKTRAIKALAKNIDCIYSRIQFTPDLRSTDITGRQTYYSDDNGEHFKFEKGPIFANLVLADEINRAPSRVQNSLLEAMEERQITVGGQAYKMPDLFMVMATQNPVEQAGTYALPEAQMDRFLMHVTVTYPDEDSEVEIIRMVRAEEAAKRQEAGEEGQKADKPSGAAKPAPTDQKTIFAARREIDAVAVPENVERYLIDLIFATRYPQRFNYELKSYIAAGASPRGSLSLDRCSRALAWLQGRDHVTVEDVQAMIKPALRHRILRGERALKHNVSTDEIIDDILELVKVP